MSSTPAPSELELVAAHLGRLRAEVPAAVAARLHAADWSTGTVVESGQFHRVLVLEGVGALRMTRASEAGAAPGASWAPEDSPAAHLPRRMQLVAALARQGLGAASGGDLALPVPLSEVLTVPDDDGRPWAASVLQAFVPGRPHPPHDGDAAALRGVVEALDAVDVAAPDVAERLGDPFAFRGPWTTERVARLGRLADVLPPEAADALRAAFPADRPGAAARRALSLPAAVERIAAAVTAWAAAPPDGPHLVHGDLAGHNMHWRPEPGARADEIRWTPVGILDWDLAHAGDAARNVAHLGVWHGEHLIPAIARTPEEGRRARVWLAAAALDALDDARARQELTGRPPRWGRLLRKTLPRVVDAAKALSG